VKDSTFFLIIATFPQLFILLPFVHASLSAFLSAKSERKSRIKSKSQHKKEARVDFLCYFILFIFLEH